MKFKTYLTEVRGVVRNVPGPKRKEYALDAKDIKRVNKKIEAIIKKHVVDGKMSNVRVWDDKKTRVRIKYMFPFDGSMAEAIKVKNQIMKLDDDNLWASVRSPGRNAPPDITINWTL